MTSWTYLAQRALTGEFLDVDLPIRNAELSWALSGAGSLRGTISPDVGRLRASDGLRVLEEWGTFIYAEADGEIRWGGILVRSNFEGEDWEVEAASFNTYPTGLHYDNAKTWTQADVVEPFRELWANAQWRPNAHLGVQVYAPPTGVLIGLRGTSGDNTPIAVGDITDEKWVELKADGWFEANGKLNPPARVYRKDVTEAEFTRLTEDESWRKEEKPDGAADTWTATYADPPLVEVDADPYALSWWETADIGSKLDDLASTTPFDYTERHFWEPEDAFIDVSEGLIDEDVYEWLLAFGWYGKADDNLERLYRPDYIDVGENTTIDGAVIDYLLAHGWAGKAGDNVERIYRPTSGIGEVAHVVHVHYPRAGTRRNDLVFIQGDNVTSVVSPTFDGDDFANSVTGIGAGEGALALRQEIAVDDGRLYRAALYTDKALDDSATLSSKVRDELARRQNLLQITEVTVRDHDNARIGSWQLGDDVLIQADLPWLGEVELWCRVVGWSLLTDSTARLSLSRSDSFRYGG